MMWTLAPFRKHSPWWHTVYTQNHRVKHRPGSRAFGMVWHNTVPCLRNGGGTNSVIWPKSFFFFFGLKENSRNIKWSFPMDLLSQKSYHITFPDLSSNPISSNNPTSTLQLLFAYGQRLLPATLQYLSKTEPLRSSLLPVSHRNAFNIRFSSFFPHDVRPQRHSSIFSS